MSETFDIGSRTVGPGYPAFLIGEVALTHDGSLGLAHAFVDAVAEAGADAVKFQTHIAEAESTPAEPFRVPFSQQDASRYDYWRRTAFAEDEWQGLAAHARERGVEFLSSPFSLEAVELLERIGVPAWKVGSGEVPNSQLVDRVAGTSLPVLLSSGLSPLEELDAAVERVRSAGAPVAVLQATSEYPCPPEKIGLGLLDAFRRRYGCPVGLSDHSGTIYPSIGAAALGANILEVHVTLSREMFGPDVPASVTSEELARLVEGVRLVEQALTPVDKDEAAAGLAAVRALFTRSVVARHDLDEGTVLAEDDLALKKPAGGLPPARLPEVVGRRLRRPLKRDQAVSEDDLE